MKENLADRSNADGAIPGASVNDLTPQNWRTHMASIKPGEETSQDSSADLAALRDDVAKLSSSLSEFVRTQTAATTNTVTAKKSQDRTAGASTDLETSIEYKPLLAALIAMVAGILVGLLNRGPK
jgi:hypothetical protein